MNSDRLTEFLQKGFRATLGATSSLIEILQDPQKREESLEKLTADFSQLAEEWVQKGEMTELEARNFVETILSQPSHPTSSDSQPRTEAPNPSSPRSEPSSDVQQDIQELTAQMAALRVELEKLRNAESG